MMYFIGKTVWITGASSGIGKALYKQLVSVDCKLIISGRNSLALETLRDEHSDPSKVHILLIDLGNPENVKSLCEGNNNLLSSIDIAIFNAGISQRALAEETQFHVVENIMRINFLSYVQLTLALLPHFKSRGQGHIAVTSSMVGKFATPLRSAYSASKMALHGYYDALRAEQKSSNLKITMVCPGFVQTSISLNALTANGKAQGKMDKATKNGMPVDKFARKMLRSIASQKEEVYIGGFKETKFALWVWRLFPSLFRKLISKSDVT